MVQNMKNNAKNNLNPQILILAIFTCITQLSIGQEIVKGFSCEDDDLMSTCFAPVAENPQKTTFKGRESVCLLARNGSLNERTTCLSDAFLKFDPVFLQDWDTVNLFPDLEPIGRRDTIVIDVLQGDEAFFYNYWGEFNWAYGPRWGRMHRGLDIGLDLGDSLKSTFNGIVRYAKFNQGGYGNCVVIRHFNGIETLYAHLDKIAVKPGELVLAGQFIGHGGTTGRSTGPHLHFETRYRGRSFDPEKIFAKDGANVKVDKLRLTLADITDPYIPKEEANAVKSESAKKFHVVKKGESLSAIARKHGTTVSSIQKLNSINNPNLIREGQKLRVK